MNDSLTDEECDMLLLVLRRRLLRAQAADEATVTAPRHEVLLALGLAEKFRELAQSAKVCEAFDFNGNIFARVPRAPECEDT